ncbi:hypothetical protein B0A48_14719 [Cryoendolithus antarcticus]|uniref:Uncharacterized protein n=1 Tax=Cryoendolithus antarcticus TaxID=1507870 RepID=A0A1V8SKL9_9PEZI|nr:hypothetical protein B0A48_14719 [Cryoendolithus antarcticus]
MASDGKSSGIDVDALRRPETVRANDFWFCSRSQWEILAAQAGNPLVSDEDQQAAVKQLYRIHDAGLIMETTSGIDVPDGCKACTGSSVRCRVWKDAQRMGCAYCLVKGKVCTSTARPDSPPPPTPRKPKAASPATTNRFRDFEIGFFGRPRDARSTPPSSDAEAEAEAELRNLAKRQSTKTRAQAKAKAKTTTPARSQGKAPVAPMLGPTALLTKTTKNTTVEKAMPQSAMAPKQSSVSAPTAIAPPEPAPTRNHSIFVEASDSEPVVPMQLPVPSEKQLTPGLPRNDPVSSDEEPLIAQRRPAPQARSARSESGYGSLQPTSPIAPALSPEDTLTSPTNTKHPYHGVLGETSEWWKLSREEYEAMSDHVKVRWTHIARMVSTDLGVLAGSPCQRCLDKVAEGWEEPCIVYSAAEREWVGKSCVARCAPCLTANRTFGAKLEADGEEEEEMEEEEGSEFEGSDTPSPAVKTRARINAVAGDRRTSRTRKRTPRGETVIYSDEEDGWKGLPASNTGLLATSKPKPKQSTRRRSGDQAQTPQDNAAHLHDEDTNDSDDYGIVAKPRTPAVRPSPTPRKQPIPQPKRCHTQSPMAPDDDVEDEEIAVLRAEALAEQRARQVKAFAEQKALEDEAFAAETEARIARAMLGKSRKRKSWAMMESER